MLSRTEKLWRSPSTITSTEPSTSPRLLSLHPLSSSKDFTLCTMNVFVIFLISPSTLTFPTKSSSTGRSNVTWKNVVTLLSPSWPPSKHESLTSMPTLTHRKKTLTRSLKCFLPHLTKKTRRHSVFDASKRKELPTSALATCLTPDPPSNGPQLPTSLHLLHLA